MGEVVELELRGARGCGGGGSGMCFGVRDARGLFGDEQEVNTLWFGCERREVVVNVVICIPEGAEARLPRVVVPVHG